MKKHGVLYPGNYSASPLPWVVRLLRMSATGLRCRRHPWRNADEKPQ